MLLWNEKIILSFLVILFDFVHLQADSEPPKVLTVSERKHYELITETGFYIFFLISSYIDLP